MVGVAVYVATLLGGLVICVDSSMSALLNKAQNSNRVRFVTQRVKVGLLEVAAEKG
jgi:hypothetical protein